MSHESAARWREYDQQTLADLTVGADLIYQWFLTEPNLHKAKALGAVHRAVEVQIRILRDRLQIGETA